MTFIFTPSTLTWRRDGSTFNQSRKKFCIIHTKRMQILIILRFHSNNKQAVVTFGEFFLSQHNLREWISEWEKKCEISQIGKYLVMIEMRMRTLLPLDEKTYLSRSVCYSQEKKINVKRRVEQRCSLYSFAAHSRKSETAGNEKFSGSMTFWVSVLCFMQMRGHIPPLWKRKQRFVGGWVGEWVDGMGWEYE